MLRALNFRNQKEEVLYREMNAFLTTSISILSSLHEKNCQNSYMKRVPKMEFIEDKLVKQLSSAKLNIKEK